MAIIRPRLTDHYNIPAAQADIDFAIPFINEDIPLYVDPFLLWKSPSQQDQALHLTLLSVFNRIGQDYLKGNHAASIEAIVNASECNEIGLGTSKSRKGKRIGEGKAQEILSLFQKIPIYSQAGVRHIEEISLLVEGISKDRISDFSCNFLKSFLIDFSVEQARLVGLPLHDQEVQNVYNVRSGRFENVRVSLPKNPLTGDPMILVPKRWLRHVPWINLEEYFKKHCPQDDISHRGEVLDNVKILNYNRENYGVVESYLQIKERTADDCAIDPLFRQIPIRSAKTRLADLLKLPTGKDDNADKKYEKLVEEMLPSMFYPHLDFAKSQVRNDSGSSIRDLTFYNSASTPFLKDVFETYGARQITFELKNVASIDRLHVDQINRYLAHELGRFGVLVTRNRLKKAENTRIIDLWSGQRKAIVVLDDSDLSQMVELFESKQRSPLDVLVKKYHEFRGQCP